MSTRAAATALDIDPQTLRWWVEQHGFPQTFTRDGRRAFEPREVNALRAALALDPDVEQAILRARGRLATSVRPAREPRWNLRQHLTARAAVIAVGVSGLGIGVSAAAIAAF